MIGSLSGLLYLNKEHLSENTWRLFIYSDIAIAMGWANIKVKKEKENCNYTLIRNCWLKNASVGVNRIVPSYDGVGDIFDFS